MKKWKHTLRSMVTLFGTGGTKMPELIKMKLCGRYIMVQRECAGAVVRCEKAYTELAHHAEQLYRLCCEAETKHRDLKAAHDFLTAEHTQLQMRYEMLQARYEKCSKLCNALMQHTAEVETENTQLRAEIDRLETELYD